MNKKETEKEIEIELEKWFQKNKNNPNVWNNNPIGRVLKEIVSKDGHWKNRPRRIPKTNEFEINQLKQDGQIPYSPKKEKKTKQIKELKESKESKESKPNNEIIAPPINKLNSNNNTIQENVPWENDANNW